MNIPTDCYLFVLKRIRKGESINDHLTKITEHFNWMRIVRENNLNVKQTFGIGTSIRESQV